MAMQALVMGFGGTGAHVLTSLKELSLLKHGKVPKNIKFLLFDTIADWEPGKSVQIVGGAAEERTAKSEDEAASLDPRSEYFQLADFAPDLRTHVFNFLDARRNPEAYPHLKDWLHAPWLSENVPIHQLGINIGAAQQRQIGRYAIFKNAEKILAHLRPIVRELGDLAKGSDVNVWLIGSSAGGTGAGCLIDAAYLTRLAASTLKSSLNENLKLKISGVIVLPNVYMNVRGISQGRAYSLLRELERVQEQGIPGDDKYLDISKGGLVSSRVVYDRNGQQAALVESRLFDDLFYLGSACPTESDRMRFFSSVASAIDPYLDDNSGPALLERAVNDNAAASAFGGARIYIPSETLTEIFAWEEVAEYVRRAAAPRESDDRVVGLYPGEQQDREDTATDKFRNLLALFKELLSLEDKTDRAREVFARDELNGRRIVTLWYELTGTARTPEEQTTLLTYAEPCYSLTQPERSQQSADWDLKTYRENAADKKGVKEKQEDSRRRFADKLEDIKKRYLNPNGGERTFEKGRRHVLETISRRLEKKVDDLFIEELTRRRKEFAQSARAPEQGTPLTQLLAEVTWMLGDTGPLRKVHALIGQIVAAVSKEQVDRDNRYTRALQELRDSKKSSFLDFGAWVESYQQAARDECSNYLGWYQKHELLKDMQQLVLNVEQRLRDWEHLLSQLFDGIVRRESRNEGEASALFNVNQFQLKGTLYERLYRAAHNRSALISFGRDPDPQMHGYREELRNRAARGLAAKLLNQSYWEAGRTIEGAPTLALVIALPDSKELRFSARNIRELPEKLFDLFYDDIDEKMRTSDIFDYLLWVREHKGIQPDTIAKLLDGTATTLVNAGGVPETRTLVFKEPTGDKKKDLMASLILSFGTLEASEYNYSDRNALALVKIKKPSLNEIVDIQECRDDYFTLRSGKLNNNEGHDKELRRAQVFHPFRQELEAWYIERSYQNKTNLKEVSTLSPRLVRLLEDPEMLQLFVHGIATGAVEFVNGGWIWHGPERDLVLTTKKDDPDADVVKAAVIFALKQGEGRRDTRVPISHEDARKSVDNSAQKEGKTADEMVAAFLKCKLDQFLIEHAPEQQREPLKMVFTFYCDPNTRTALQHRVNLP